MMEMMMRMSKREHSDYGNLVNLRKDKHNRPKKLQYWNNNVTQVKDNQGQLNYCCSEACYRVHKTRRKSITFVIHVCRLKNVQEVQITTFC